MFFVYFLFIGFFFQLLHATCNILLIMNWVSWFHLICFLWVITTLRHESWIWQINFVDLILIFSFFIDFFQFILQYFIDWELCFMVCFDLFSIRLAFSHVSSHQFDGLTQVELLIFEAAAKQYVADFWIDSNKVHCRFLNRQRQFSLSISKSTTTYFSLSISKPMAVMCTDKSMDFVKPDKNYFLDRPILGWIERYKPACLRENLRGRESTYLRGELE